jgi:plastocyanin
MKKQTRDRLVLPILLPVGILVVIVAALYGFSRILLSISHNAATATALVVALAIVVVSAVVAGRRIVRPSSFAGLVGAVTGVAMIAGGIALATVGTEGEGGGEGEGPATNVTIVAVNIAFQPTEIEVPAGQPFTITLDNQDAGIQHNVDIFDNPDFTGDAIFAGELITGPAQVTYDVPALEPGAYPFRCVVHPNMVGTIRAVEGGGGPGGGGPGGPAIAVVAQDIAFDTDTLELTADTPATITFDNRDAGVQHNIAIYQDDSLETVLFKGDLVTGAATIEYQIPPLPAGEYYFRCDVHPSMQGTVIVRGGDGGGSTGATGPPGGGTSGVTVTAKGVAFDTAEITLPAGQESAITLVNEDAGVQHNIVISTDASMSDELFNGELITGPATVTYTIPPLEPGTYYFYCLVHPNMNGVVTVA